MRTSPAAKVAAVAPAAVAGVYIIGVIVLNLLVTQHLTEQNDERLAGRLTVARQDPAVLSQRVARTGPANSPGDAGSDFDADSAPVFLWLANARGAVTGHSPGAPALPSA
ncbi:MAG: hypothetical protein ACRDOD_21565, partial [Streptosporangiaceae bacterium]